MSCYQLRASKNLSGAETPHMGVSVQTQLLYFKNLSMSLLWERMDSIINRCIIKCKNLKSKNFEVNRIFRQHPVAKIGTESEINRNFPFAAIPYSGSIAAKTEQSCKIALKFRYNLIYCYQVKLKLRII